MEWWGILIIEKTWLQKLNFKIKFQYDSPPSNSIFKRVGIIYTHFSNLYMVTIRLTYLKKGTHPLRQTCLRTDKTRVLTTQAPAPDKLVTVRGWTLDVVDFDVCHKWLAGIPSVNILTGHTSDLNHHLQVVSKSPLANPWILCAFFSFEVTAAARFFGGCHFTSCYSWICSQEEV